MKRVLKNIAGSLVFVLSVGGFVMVYIPMELLGLSFANNLEIGMFRYVGITPAVIGGIVLIRCWADFITIGKGTPAPYQPAKELVVSGLYGISRNPMYIGVLLVLLGEAIFFRSVLILLYAGSLFLVFHGWVTFYEEPLLHSTFGESYNKYCRSVPRWFFKRCDNADTANP